VYASHKKTALQKRRLYDCAPIIFSQALLLQQVWLLPLPWAQVRQPLLVPQQWVAGTRKHRGLHTLGFQWVAWFLCQQPSLF
jgi:hypothetical protein